MVSLSFIVLLGLYPLFSSGTPLGTPVRPQQPHQPRQSTTSCTPSYTCPAAPCSAIRLQNSAAFSGELTCIYSSDDFSEGEICSYSTSSGAFVPADSDDLAAPPNCPCPNKAVDSNNCPTAQKRSSIEIIGAKRESYDPALWRSKRTAFTGRREDA